MDRTFRVWRRVEVVNRAFFADVPNSIFSVPIIGWRILAITNLYAGAFLFENLVLQMDKKSKKFIHFFSFQAAPRRIELLLTD